MANNDKTEEGKRRREMRKAGKLRNDSLEHKSKRIGTQIGAVMKGEVSFIILQNERSTICKNLITFA